ncbi:TonB-dependent siderophore receptor [Limoniibacter endophyticus]|uniref:Ligand-gated channel n=1 Tax=Limoniibacter endophyticus TaxID=1565040 RepID=A0A8J3GHW7_9HYPH|nr:TonB-dependent siderophore receptor [Limoniibacter endophyticus]GHC73641.1 ligand-gated channel [Limoniibacter endophyticus]
MSRLISFKAFFGLSASSLVFLSGAHAQSDDPVELDRIVIEGEGGASVFSNAAVVTGPVEGYVAAQSATGTKTTTPLIETPQSISVITTQQLEDRGVQNLDQALGYTAGVVASPFGTDARYFNPIIRGFDAKDSVYLNSFRFIRDFSAIAFETFGQERIDVIKGPASVLYGQGEPGGLINLVAKRSTFERFIEAGAEVGTNDRYVLKFDGGDAYNDVLSYRLTALGRLADGQQDFTSDDRFYFAPSLTWAPDEDTSLTILGALQYDTGTSPLGLPQSGTLDFNPNGVIPINRYIGEPGFNDAESLYGNLGYEFRHRFNETFEFRQNVQYGHFDADFNNLYFSSLAADNRTVNRGVNVQSETTNSFAVDNQLEAKFDTGIAAHTALLGLDYRSNKQWRSSNFTGTITPIDVFNPVYGAVPSVDTSLADITNSRIRTLGIYAQDQVAIDRLRLNFGLRQDWFDIDNSSLKGITKTTTLSEVKDQALTGRVGVLYLFDSGWAPYVNYSTSFNPQSGTVTATQRALDPSKGEIIEGGIKYQPEGSNTLLTASIYELTKTNIATTTNFVTTQVGEARSRGFELEAKSNLAAGLDLIASYTYADTRIMDGGDELDGPNGTLLPTTGNRLKDIPLHSASLWLGYTFREDTTLAGLKLGAGARYVGERYGNNTNTVKLPDNIVFDASVAFEKKNFKASLAVQNIADEHYVASCNFGCFYGEGRTVVGNLSYKW